MKAESDAADYVILIQGHKQLNIFALLYSTLLYIELFFFLVNQQRR